LSRRLRESREIDASGDLGHFSFRGAVDSDGRCFNLWAWTGCTKPYKDDNKAFS